MLCPFFIEKVRLAQMRQILKILRLTWSFSYDDDDDDDYVFCHFFFIQQIQNKHFYFCVFR